MPLPKTGIIVASLGALCLLASSLQARAESRTIEQIQLDKYIADSREQFHQGKRVIPPPEPPKGMRSGAHSLPFASGLHGEVPQKYACVDCGYSTAYGYDQAHYNTDSGFLPASSRAYTGQYPLPAGTWTGEPLLPAETAHELTWSDAQEKIRPGDASGAPMKITASAGNETPAQKQ